MQHVIELLDGYHPLLNAPQEKYHASLIPALFPFVIVPRGWFKFSVVNRPEEAAELPPSVRGYLVEAAKFHPVFMVKNELSVLQFTLKTEMTTFEVHETRNLCVKIVKRRKVHHG